MSDQSISAHVRTATAYSTRDAVYHHHLIAAQRADARARAVLRGAITVSTAADAAALFEGVPERQARRLARKYPLVTYAIALLPRGWRWSA